MTISDVADQYFTYEARLASFQTHSKRRASNASTKGSKTLKWAHKFLPPEELASAGFFYFPLPTNPDNVACFLCHKTFDEWEKGDDPLVEHLAHSPDCGWAIVATIERQDGVLSQENPASKRMIEARRATFADKWPHETKRGWKCKTKQLVDAGWIYTPTLEFDDKATCVYCALSLDDWENTDEPLEEHHRRSPECAFFALVNQAKNTAVKRSKSKRTSKAPSRLSTQSQFTVASDAQSIIDLPTEEGDSVLTTATNATATQATRKARKTKKAPAPKGGRKTRAKKTEPEPVEVEVEDEEAPEPEDADFEVKVPVPAKPTRGRKRKSDEGNDSNITIVKEIAPPPKRRATRTRGSVAAEDSVLMDADITQQDSGSSRNGQKGRGRRTRGSTTVDDSILSVPDSVLQGPDVPKKDKRGRPSSRKVSAVSKAEFSSLIPNDDELNAALEADLERMSDVETVEPPRKRAGRASKTSKSSHHMFDPEPIKIDEAAIDAELEAMEVDPKPLPKAKGAAKGKQPRKPSVRQQAAAKKAAEAAEAAEAERLAEQEAFAEQEASQQITAELEHSISIVQNSSPIVQPKKQRASRQPAQKAPASLLSIPKHMEQPRMESEEPSRFYTPAPEPIPAPRSPTPPREATPPPREATPSDSPQSSDAENHPPSSKPSAATKKTATPHSTKRMPLAETTPSNLSPSKRNIIAGLQSLHPWSSVDLDTVFMKSPGGENVIVNSVGLFGEQVKTGVLTSPEKKMTVEEWIHHNAEQAEEKLRNECERMVSIFELHGTKAMQALEGIECID